MLPSLLDRVRPLRGRPGPPRRRVKLLIGDKGYDYPSVYAELRQRGITGYIPRRGSRDKVTVGRWIVEQAFALLHQYRRLAVRRPGGNAGSISMKASSTPALPSSAGDDSATEPIGALTRGFLVDVQGVRG